MVQRNDRGVEAREYFIKCEKRLKELAPQTLSQALTLAYEQ